MWEFKVPQKRFKIGKVEVGGIPGEYATVLVGSMFYHKHKIVINERTGEFDKAAAEKLVNLQEEFSDKTGNPCMIDVVGTSPETLSKYLDFLAGVTDAPLLMDGVSSSIRLGTLDWVKESGLQDRIVYNSLTPEYTPEEMEKIKETGITSSIILAYYMKDFTTKGRVYAIKKLVEEASKYGVDKPLVDTCVIDVPSLGIGANVIQIIKDETGLPVGCGAHNAIGTWRGLKKKMGKQALHPAMAAANVLAASVGADFLLYGPIEACEYMFPVIAMVDAAYGQLQMEKGKMPSRMHPIFRIA